MSTSPTLSYSPASPRQMGALPPPPRGDGGDTTTITQPERRIPASTPASPLTPNSVITTHSIGPRPGPQISLPALHLGSFHSLSLKDFEPRIGDEDGDEDEGVEMGAGEDVSGNLVSSDANRVIGGREHGDGQREHPGNTNTSHSTSTAPPTFTIGQSSQPTDTIPHPTSDTQWTLPKTREVNRRLTVVERPLSSHVSGVLPVRSSSDGQTPAAVGKRTMMTPTTTTSTTTRESETAELGIITSSGGTSMAGGDSRTNSSKPTILQTNMETSTTTTTTSCNDFRPFPTPPSRENIPPVPPLELPKRQPSGPSTGSPMESPNSVDRKKRRLPSTPVGQIPGQRAVSSPSWTPRGAERSMSDPEVGAVAGAGTMRSQSFVQSPLQVRQGSLPRVKETGVISPPPPPPPPQDNLDIYRPHVGQVGIVDAIPSSPSPRVRQLELDEIARNSFDRQSAIPTATPQAQGGLSGIPAYLAMDMSGGPYPSHSRPAVEVAQQQQQASTSRPSGAAPFKVKLPPPQEEICLECLMRDRDLIHVDVMTDGVWERASDVDWREMLEREREWEWDVEQAQAEGYLVADSDGDFLRAVPWRGFRWEEEDGGTGLPVGFRGRDGGMLLEERLKELALRMNSPSSHRAKTLRKYLDDLAAMLDPIALKAAQLPSTRRPSRAEELVADPRLELARSPLERHTVYADGPSCRDPQRDIEERIARDRAQANRARGTSIGSQSRLPMFDLDESPLPRSREVVEQTRRVPTSSQLLHERKGRGISSPGLLETGAPDDRHYPPTDNDWMMDEQVTPPIRPFSFAVWAGRNGDTSGAYSARSSPGPRPGSRYDDDGSVRSGQGGFFGKWGGSVTSFFGGSQGGASGSMMDMHLGLDADRRYADAHAHAHTDTQPRSLSMVPTPRPRFFSRNSRASSFLHDGEFGNDVGHMPVSTPAATTIQPYAEAKQKKGLKGFLAKLGGKKKRSRTSPIEDSRPYREEDYASTSLAPLAPPPPLSYLVDRQPQHKRTPSGGPMGGPSAPSATYQPDHPPQTTRSVSAPLMNSSSSGSLPSVSPTSSRYYPGAGRESYPASQGSRRRSSGGPLMMGGKVDSGVEVLEGEMMRWEEPVVRYGRAPPSLTNSSGTLLLPSVESPGLGLRPLQQSHGKMDKQKMLPPLPGDDFSPSSPDSFNAFFGDRYTYDERSDPRLGVVGGGAGQQQHARQASAGQASYSSGRRTRSKFGLRALFGAEGRGRSGVDGESEQDQREMVVVDGPRYRQTYYQ